MTDTGTDPVHIKACAHCGQEFKVVYALEHPLDIAFCSARCRILADFEEEVRRHHWLKPNGD